MPPEEISAPIRSFIERHSCFVATVLTVISCAFFLVIENSSNGKKFSKAKDVVEKNEKTQ